MIVHARTTRHTRHGLHETWNGILLTKEASLCVWNMLFIISTGRGTAAIHQRTEYGTLKNEMLSGGRSSRTRQISPIFGHRAGQSSLEGMIVG